MHIARAAMFDEEWLCSVRSATRAMFEEWFKELGDAPDLIRTVSEEWLNFCTPDSDFDLPRGSLLDSPRSAQDLGENVRSSNPAECFTSVLP